jgi:hypothetical protein
MSRPSQCLARSLVALDREYVRHDIAQLDRAQRVANRHLVHELEHRLSADVKPEQIAPLASRRLPSRERMAISAILCEQHLPGGPASGTGTPATPDSRRDGEGYESCRGAHSLVRSLELLGVKSAGVSISPASTASGGSTLASAARPVCVRA